MAVEPVKGLTLLSGGHPAPKLELTDIDGNQHRLSDYRGQVVIVNFWATWCPPCRREMPSMQRAWERLRSDGIVMLAVDIGEDEDTIFAFTANYDIDFPLLMDLESSTTNDWPVLGLPSTFIVDTKGALVYRAIGGREWDSPELLKAIRALAK
ncbi:MAG: TlpA disulfide reductase family protein [Candidatus Sedimenticola sp. (ex Thyasira tokunagai)]